MLKFAAMSRFGVFRTLHFIFLGILISFILFYFYEYIPLKAQRICREVSAKATLKSNSADAYEFYKNHLRSCLSKGY